MGKLTYLKMNWLLNQLGSNSSAANWNIKAAVRNWVTLVKLPCLPGNVSPLGSCQLIKLAVLDIVDMLSKGAELQPSNWIDN